MNQNQERKVLRALLRRIDTEPNAFFHGKLFLVLLWFPLFFIFGISFHLTQMYDFGPILLCSVSGLVGAFMFWVFLRRAGQRNWPVVKPYIDRDRIEERLNELET